MQDGMTHGQMREQQLIRMAKKSTVTTILQWLASLKVIWISLNILISSGNSQLFHLFILLSYYCYETLIT